MLSRTFELELGLTQLLMLTAPLFVSCSQDEDISGTILPPGTRRSTRNAGIDYSSEAALQKAGVTKQELEAEDAEEEDFKMKEDDHHD